MAAYTSTQSGPWSDPNTWGGAGTPSVVGDTATISAGHTVTYDVSSTTELGQITVYGTLEFSTSMSTKLHLGHADIRVENGGLVKLGTSASPLSSSYTCDIGWNTTSDNAKGFLIVSGGQVKMYGNSGYYGGTDSATLASDWTTGSTLTVTGDVTSWPVGGEIYIHKGTTYASYLTDTFLGTINTLALSGSNTDITINEAHPGGTFYTGGRVVCVSRNVRFYKIGASTTIGNYNTNRPKIYNANTTRDNVVFDEVLMTGFRGGCGNFVTFNGVMRNFSHGSMSGGYIEGVVTSANYWMYTSRGTVLDVKAFANQNSSYAAGDIALSGEYFGNDALIYVYTNDVSIKDAYVYGNKYFIQSATGIIKISPSVVIGWDSQGNSIKNSIDYMYDRGEKLIIRGAKLPSAGLSFTNRNHTNPYKADVYSADHNKVVGAQYRYAAYADVLNNSTTTRTGGASESIEVIPLSNCRTETGGVKIFEWTEKDVDASSWTRSIYIKGEGWATFPTASELYFEAEYISDATTLETTTVTSTETLTDNSTWTAFSVSFNPATQGDVRYRCYLKTYESGAKVYIDHALYDGSGNEYTCDWKDGESYIRGDYPAESDVRLGMSYDSGNKTGTLDLPLVSDVESGVTFDGGTKTGIFVVPSENEVLASTGYGANGTEFTGTAQRYLLPLEIVDISTDYEVIEL